MTKQEFINAFKTIEGQVNPLQKFITKVGIIEMIDNSTEENIDIYIDIVFNELLESITTTGVVKYDNDEITIGITTEPKTEEPVIDEPVIDEPVIDEPTTEPTVEPTTEPTVEPTTEPTVEPTESNEELPETEQ